MQIRLQRVFLFAEGISRTSKQYDPFLKHVPRIDFDRIQLNSYSYNKKLISVKKQNA